MIFSEKKIMVFNYCNIAVFAQNLITDHHGSC